MRSLEIDEEKERKSQSLDRARMRMKKLAWGVVLSMFNTLSFIYVSPMFPPIDIKGFNKRNSIDHRREHKGSGLGNVGRSKTIAKTRRSPHRDAPEQLSSRPSVNVKVIRCCFLERDAPSIINVAYFSLDNQNLPTGYELVKIS